MTAAKTRGGFGSLFRFTREKILPPVSQVAKGVTWLAGFVAAVSAVILWFPAAYDQVMWRQVEYDLLAKIHASNNAEYVDSILGTPAIRRDFDQLPGLVENIYVRRDYYVMTVTNDAQRVLLYSVLSCSADFAPSFMTPMGSKARLQSVPLAEAETFRASSTNGSDPNDRNITYTPALTGSSLGQFVETGIVSGSTAGRIQHWFVGVNSACGSTSGFGAESLPDSFVDRLPPDVREYRWHTAANFYAETATGVEVHLSEEANLALGGKLPADSNYTGLFVSPYHFNLPSQDGGKISTRTF